MNKVACVAIGALALTLGGCAGSGQHEGAGTVLGAGAGAVAGGLIGGAVGGSGGTVVGALTGAAVGGLAGNAIGRDLDEQERMAWEDARYGAFDSGARRSWRGRRSYGYIEPGEVYSDPRGQCRQYRQTIYINGRPRAASGVACRGPNGWEVVS